MNSRTMGFVIVAAAAYAMPALAHHSFAMFDHDKTVTLKGTVQTLEWTNPHAWINMVVADASGKPIKYAIEMASPLQQTKVGWTPTSVKSGDKISVDIHPLKDGSRGGQFISIVLANGKKLGNGGAPNNSRGGGPYE